jgi:hypothetical protein
MFRIRDPIHGSIKLSRAEMQVVDAPVFQRLRGIKQLGFTDLAFPGATHTRYAHALGSMHLAGRMFEAVFPLEHSPLSGEARARLLQGVRMALLLHDIGHAPASHASESAMPLRSALALPGQYSAEERAAQATHEDYTLKLMLQSSLRPTLDAALEPLGLDALAIAQLVTGRFPEHAQRFVVDGVDYGPLLGQIATGEMDADRMDYLQRDSFYAGVAYGQFDQQWLLENLRHHLVGDQAFLALTHRALFAFEDFLLSRYHMFVSVYFHYISVGFESMLASFFQEAPNDFPLPTDAEAYAQIDDITLWTALRASDNRWAQRIAKRAAFRRVVEFNAQPGMPDVDAMSGALKQAGVEHFVSRTSGVLSKYAGGSHRPIYVINRTLGQTCRMEEYSRIFERYAQPAPLVRIYCEPGQVHAARTIARAFVALEPSIVE